MTLTVACPSCGHRLGIPENFVGELFRCKQCGASFKVTAPAAPPADAGAAIPVAPFNPFTEAAPAAPRGVPNPIRFSCPNCQMSFESPLEQAGTKFNCTSCGQRLQVPAPPQNRTVLGSLDPPPCRPTPSPSAHAAPIPYAQYDNPVDRDNEAPPRRRRRRRFRGDDDYYDEGPPSGGGAGMGLGITAMILGIVAIPFAIFPCLGLFVLPIAGLGLVLGLLGLILGNSERRGNIGFAIAGLATSGAALLLALVWLLAFPHAWDRRGWGWWW